MAALSSYGWKQCININFAQCDSRFAPSLMGNTLYKCFYTRYMYEWLSYPRLKKHFIIFFNSHIFPMVNVIILQLIQRQRRKWGNGSTTSAITLAHTILLLDTRRYTSINRSHTVQFWFRINGFRPRPVFSSWHLLAMLSICIAISLFLSRCSAKLTSWHLICLPTIISMLTQHWG